MKKRLLLNLWLILPFILASCGVSKLNKYALNYVMPISTNYGDSLWVSGANQLSKNPAGLWNLYLEGDALSRGLNAGKLTDSIYKLQEKYFFNRVEEMIPVKKQQRFLNTFLAWYNRKLSKNIIEEHKQEIYGLSRFSSDSLNFIAKKYPRSLYLHGAHDIGHALQDLALVGCTSFAVWGENTEDENLLIGRNFDFYAGDDFAQNKVVAFVKPDEGNPFMYVTWPGMIGVVSGMNLAGLTVTINAGKSTIPLVARTPVSLLTREILQYANTIEKAIEIAHKRKVFVSESILVGSGDENKAVLIEVSPNKIGVYDIKNSSELVCSNHFQSKVFSNDKNNIAHKLESHSQYRFDRMKQLLEEYPKVNVEIAANILRNKEGLENKNIGLGNEKSINQLHAHHSIIFKPRERKVWVSSYPFQLGEYIAYDLNQVFSDKEIHYNQYENIAADPFLKTKEYADFKRYKQLDNLLNKALKEGINLKDDFFEDYIVLNPEFWEVYYKSGMYFKQRKQKLRAEKYFNKALEKEITTATAKREIEKIL